MEIRVGLRWRGSSRGINRGPDRLQEILHDKIFLDTSNEVQVNHLDMFDAPEMEMDDM